MNRIYAGIAAVAVAFAGLVATDNLDPLNMGSKPVVVTSDPGGAIFDFIGKYNQMKIDGTKLEIRGVCASACTFFLGLLPKEQVCYDDRAYLGFHGVYSGGFMVQPTFNQPMTEWTYSYVYTPEVISRLNKLGWSVEHDVDHEKNPTGLIWQHSDFMRDLGYKKCD